MYDSKKDTINHIMIVSQLIGTMKYELGNRMASHDKSKLEKLEKDIFDEYTPKLKDSTYGSEEYYGFLKGMKVALDHHYAENRHHPEHFEDGIRGMTLVDLCEMIADWKAASLRHDNGDIMKSIEINQERFGYSDELKQILINTVNEFFDYTK